MNTIILLFLLGGLLLSSELFVPGVVMGLLGLITLVMGCGLAFQRYGAGIGALVSLGAIFLAVLTATLEFVWLPRTRFGQKLFLKKAIVSTSQPLPADAETMVGKEAEALTILAPSGYVQVEGRSYEAFSQDGHAAKGSRLLVKAVDRLTLKVSKLPS